jgi:transketolase
MIDEIDLQAIKYAKSLAAEAVQNAGSGHPGTAVSLAPAAYLMYQKIMNLNPQDTGFQGRDRFILSAGHASVLQYIQFYLGGFGYEMLDLKNLRTVGSKTPAHPEYGQCPGVEMSTGPLGQGLASAVGFAIAQKYEKELFDPNTPDDKSPFFHRVYSIAGDGCFQEGITSEAASIAGNLKLGNLILLYDANDITIEDDTSITFTEDVLARYKSYGWHTEEVSFKSPKSGPSVGTTQSEIATAAPVREAHRNDGRAGSGPDQAEYSEDLTELNNAFERAIAETDKPSIIKLNTLIAWPTPNMTNSGDSHGNVLGEENVVALRKILGLEPGAFSVDESVITEVRTRAKAKGEIAQSEFDEKFNNWKSKAPEKFELWNRAKSGEFPDKFFDNFPTFVAGEKPLATRVASGQVLNYIAGQLPEFLGGSADLGPSNNTLLKGFDSFGPPENSSKKFTTSYSGKNLHFGIREHAMAAIENGIILGSYLKPYCAGFFTFSDYEKPAIRLAALMNIPSLFIFTHDSIGVGEDGPTHQPIEQLAGLRAIPNLSVIRPADANETTVCYKKILQNFGKGSGNAEPSTIVLSRQNLPVLNSESVAGADKGGYILSDSIGAPSLIIVATGSEVSLALETKQSLGASATSVRVVSMPCIEWFEQQSQEYKDSVLVPGVKVLTIEAGSTMPWYKYCGKDGYALGIDHFGEPGSAAELFEKFGFTIENVVKIINTII